MSDIDLIFAYPIGLATLLIDRSMSIVQGDRLGPRSTADVCVNA